MTDQKIAIPLTSPERDLIRDLRAIPDSALKRRVLAAVEELIHLGCEPRCAEAQADGVPCGCSRADCATCNRVGDLVTAIVETTLPPHAA